MEKDIVYFDLETRRTAADVGGWNHKDKMGISVSVTFSTRLNEYRIYTEEETGELIAQLQRADLVVGYNQVSFDYGVLMAHTVLDLRESLNSLDLLIDLEKKLGHRLKLDAVASATLGGLSKTADGLDAIRWWQQGKIVEIAEYCCYDVKVTKCVHEYGAKHGHVKYLDRNRREQIVEVNW
jgi:DEAD/DEAH box helicase domain-containing protein